tara:strand:+ start:273 stop:674 length:402 start_codon:yes stop_codon:yes gene_type:complete
MKKLEEGFYHLTSKQEPEPVLVHGYRCTDMEGHFVLGFNTHDGGSLLPLSDLTSDSKLTKVSIVPNEMSGSEAIFGFMAWLTSRDEITPELGASRDAGVAAQLIEEFCNTNNLSEPKENWTDNLTHPKPVPQK